MTEHSTPLCAFGKVIPPRGTLATVRGSSASFCSVQKERNRCNCGDWLANEIPNQAEDLCCNAFGVLKVVSMGALSASSGEW